MTLTKPDGEVSYRADMSFEEMNIAWSQGKSMIANFAGQLLIPLRKNANNIFFGRGCIMNVNNSRLSGYDININTDGIVIYIAKAYDLSSLVIS